MASITNINFYSRVTNDALGFLGASKFESDLSCV
jgi:hypothetical protein